MDGDATWKTVSLPYSSVPIAYEEGITLIAIAIAMVIVIVIVIAMVTSN